MPNLNKVLLMGNMTRDIDLKYTPKGTPIGEFGLAINRNYKTESGEKREEVTFVDVEFWGKQAETISEFFKKGDPIYVEGRLKLDTWDDKETGKKRSKLRVVGESFQFLKSKGDSGGTREREEADARYQVSEERPAYQKKPYSPPPQQQGRAGDMDAPEDEDDVPF